MKIICDVCKRSEATMKNVDDPLSKALLHQSVKWNYCRPCYQAEFDLIETVKGKYDDPKELEEVLTAIRESR